MSHRADDGDEPVRHDRDRSGGAGLGEGRRAGHRRPPSPVGANGAGRNNPAACATNIDAERQGAAPVAQRLADRLPVDIVAATGRRLCDRPSRQTAMRGGELLQSGDAVGTTVAVRIDDIIIVELSFIGRPASHLGGRSVRVRRLGRR
jgi:hypothetical protein